MKRWLAIILLLHLCHGCAHLKREVIPPAGWVEVGIASWYGKDFHGRRTASGAIYDMYQLTAAHRTLPFGTVVMVTHLGNKRATTVTINDRGPFVRGRIIDLSYAAAEALGMVAEGVARVKIEVLDNAALSHAKGAYTVQVGAFIEHARALQLLHRLQGSYPQVAISEFRTRSAIYYRVRVGRFQTKEEAYQLAAQLAQDGYAVFLTHAE